MSTYAEVARRIGIPDGALECMTGALAVPGKGLVDPGKFYRFVPAMIPLWRTMDGFVGYWKHWFCDRRLTIVEVTDFPIMGKRSYLAEEKARDFQQLARWAIFDQMSINGGVPDDVPPFARALGIDDWELIAERMEKIEWLNDESVLLSLPAFANQVPLEFIGRRMEYSGDFPHTRLNFWTADLRKFCTKECSDAVRRKTGWRARKPSWFKRGDQRKRFDSLLAERDLCGAWMCLNSDGWLFRDVYDALAALADATDDKDFQLLAEAWCKLNHDKPEGSAF